MEGFRHHVARFASKKDIDPRNSTEFIRPVRLHRRDPRAPAGGAGGSKDEGADDAAIDPKAAIDDKERERLEIIRAEKEAQREAEMAQVAPAANTGGQKKVNTFKKKTQQIFRNDKTDEQKAESKLRYEEALPWHLEDFDNRNTWVGSYEAALSETYAYLVHGQDGKFHMVPLEKWYKFTPKHQFKTLTIEEAENRMGKKVKDPRWFMQSQQATKEMQNEQENKKATSKLFLGKWEKGAGDGGSSAPRVKREEADADDLDFQEDVADDEADGVIEGDDEDLKQAEERIKRDQLQANIFDLKDEKEYDQVEQAEREKKDAERKLGKGVRKALLKREKNYVYDTDSGNPYSDEVFTIQQIDVQLLTPSQSETDDTETERLKEEERKKNEDKKPGSDLEKANPPKSKVSSGASSKGTNTPTQRPSKPSDTLKKPSTNALKRPGSPNLSEASGNESTRKKAKKQHTPLPPPSQSHPQPPSRPMSPAQGLLAPENTTLRPSLPNSRKPSNTRLPADAKASKSNRSPGKGPHSRAGSGSENEAAGSGAEKSDGARQRIKLKFGKKAAANNGSASVSRAGSPDVRGGETQSRGGQTGGSDGTSCSISDHSHLMSAELIPAKTPTHQSYPFPPQPNSAPAFHPRASKSVISSRISKAKSSARNEKPGSRNSCARIPSTINQLSCCCPINLAGGNPLGVLLF